MAGNPKDINKMLAVLLAASMALKKNIFKPKDEKPARPKRLSPAQRGNRKKHT